MILLTLFYKRPDAFIYPQFYAEEGIYFFSDAYHQGISSIFNTCSGYFHLYPRLIFCTALAIKTPIPYMPYVCTYSWLLLLLLLQLYIWKRVSLPRNRLFFISLCTVLVPLQAEVLMNLTNVQWIMALFPLIVFTCDDAQKNKNWFWMDVIVLLLCGFTGPNMVILSPLILFLAFKNKSHFRKNYRLVILYALALIPAVISTVSLLQHGNISRAEGEFNLMNPGFIDYIYVQYALLFLGKFAFDTPFVVKCLAVLLMIVYTVYVIQKIFKNYNLNQFAIACFLAGLLYLITTLISYRNNPSILHPHYGGTRNFYLPAVLIIWYIASVLKERQSPTLVLALLSLLFAMENVRAIGRERLIDYEWPIYSKKITVSDTLSVPINPDGWHLFINNRKTSPK
ncbi:MAG: hypothetical protein IT236_05635 [Bacteroidia bacterium]|nr:hypothetical protein [Bacteroidia bacterium]